MSAWGGSSLRQSWEASVVAGGPAITARFWSNVLHEGTGFWASIALSSVSCPPGWVSSTGQTPCQLCPPGRACPSAQTTSPVLCPPGRYSLQGADSCMACPVGRYGLPRSWGLSTPSCSGVCVAQPGQGCGPGAKAARGVDCPPGQYGVGGSVDCQPCPAGRFGEASALYNDACSGECTAEPGWWCPPGCVNAFGQQCDSGYYSPGGPQLSSCTACPAGVFGSAASTSSACSGSCQAVAGYSCSAGAVNSTGSPCPPGRHSSAKATKCERCPPGKYSDQFASPECFLCPAGRYGGSAGLTSPLCSGPCLPSAG
jgi:hypothetical protein